MNGLRSRKRGFTLVELMVVAIIVAILAAVAIPLMSANKKRAMATEAQAGLGTIRTALRAMYAETSFYNEDLTGLPIANGSPPTRLPGIGLGDLDGRYFDDTAYELTTVGETTYLLTCDGSKSGAPESDQVTDVKITLDSDGKFTYVSGI
jgi:prepilin-type N-terminal cleavage/methylation domain-containing protein